MGVVIHVSFRDFRHAQRIHTFTSAMGTDFSWSLDLFFVCFVLYYAERDGIVIGVRIPGTTIFVGHYHFFNDVSHRSFTAGFFSVL